MKSKNILFHTYVFIEGAVGYKSVGNRLKLEGGDLSSLTTKNENRIE